MPYDRALEAFLRRLKSRSRLSASEQEAILRLKTKRRHVKKNHDVVSPGQTVDHACLVERGVAARYDQMADGERQITAFHIAGDMCDLHSVVCPTAAWGILALNDVTIVEISHGQLRRLVTQFPNVALAFWRDVTADASIFAKWIGNLGRRNAKARTAHLICEFGLLMEASDLGTRDDFHLDISQTNLADALGLTAVHVNRTFKQLRAGGLIETSGRAIRIPDWDKLAAVANFDALYLLLGPTDHSLN